MWPWLLAIAALLAFQGTAYAQPEAVKAAREAVVESIERLEEIRSLPSVNQDERDEIELELRRDALKKIIAFTVLETAELKTKMERLKDVEAPFIILEDPYLETLERFLDDLKTNQGALDQALTSDEVRKIAGAFAEWRASNYNPAMRRMTAFALAFQNRTLLKVADQRFIKVASDLKKSKIGQEIWQGLLGGAALRLREAREHNNQAINALSQFLPTEQNLSPSMQEADSPPEEPREEPETAVKYLVEKSLGSMRGAYKNFLELNELLKRH